MPHARPGRPFPGVTLQSPPRSPRLAKDRPLSQVQGKHLQAWLWVEGVLTACGRREDPLRKPVRWCCLCVPDHCTAWNMRETRCTEHLVLLDFSTMLMNLSKLCTIPPTPKKGLLSLLGSALLQLSVQFHAIEAQYTKDSIMYVFQCSSLFFLMYRCP